MYKTIYATLKPYFEILALELDDLTPARAISKSMQIHKSMPAQFRMNPHGFGGWTGYRPPNAPALTHRPI
ncbi:MAG: hypothetical protein OXU23_14295 [Candidatus Poribacteria bacterium]|nr:hypothetical protein [Candidatus Poribacteria bacterium]